MILRLACAVALMLPLAAAARPAAGQAVTGDQARTTGPDAPTGPNAPAVLQHFQTELKADSTNYGANWQAAVGAVTVGEFMTDKAKQTELYSEAERYARAAVKANPNDAAGHFALALALGRRAQSLGSRDRVKYAGEVRDHALQALKLDSTHAGALHIMGMWNAEIMRLSGVSRFFAKNLLGGKTFDQANWKDAQRYLEEAVQQEPHRLTHHLDLGRVYADAGDSAKAREQLELVVKGPPTDYNDANYQKAAQEALARLK